MTAISRARILSCSTIRVEYWIYKYSGTESCSRRSPTKHYQAGRCVSGSTKRMWEIFDISTCAEVCAHLADRGFKFLMYIFLFQVIEKLLVKQLLLIFSVLEGTIFLSLEVDKRSKSLSKWDKDLLILASTSVADCCWYVNVFCLWPLVFNSCL